MTPVVLSEFMEHWVCCNFRECYAMIETQVHMHRSDVIVAWPSKQPKSMDPERRPGKDGSAGNRDSLVLEGSVSNVWLS